MNEGESKGVRYRRLLVLFFALTLFSFLLFGRCCGSKWVMRTHVRVNKDATRQIDFTVNQPDHVESVVVKLLALSSSSSSSSSLSMQHNRNRRRRNATEWFHVRVSISNADANIQIRSKHVITNFQVAKSKYNFVEWLQLVRLSIASCRASCVAFFVVFVAFAFVDDFSIRHFDNGIGRCSVAALDQPNEKCASHFGSSFLFLIGFNCLFHSALCSWLCVFTRLRSTLCVCVCVCAVFISFEWRIQNIPIETDRDTCMSVVCLNECHGKTFDLGHLTSLNWLADERFSGRRCEVKAEKETKKKQHSQRIAFHFVSQTIERTTQK